MPVDATTGGLHSLLFHEGMQLGNIKFFAGNREGLTAEQLKAAADRALRSAKRKGFVDNPPHTGRTPATL